MKKLIAPSLLSADKKNMRKEIKKVESLGAEYIHWDIMDGKFVPNKNFSPTIVKKYAKVHKMVNDVHIMVANPRKDIPLYAKAGADLITFHYEACKSIEEVEELIKLCHSNKVKAGVSIKPKTPVKVLKRIIGSADLVLIMSVEPGKGGQAFIPSALKKIKKLRKWIDARHYKCLIEVDGGINAKTGQACRKAGVDILVAGSYLFGHKDIKERINSLKWLK